MVQIVPAGSLNIASLSTDDFYVVVVNPPGFIRGVPTDVFGVVGTGSWGPSNSPVHMGSGQDATSAFGPISAISLTDPFDLATDLYVAFGQSANQSSIEGFGVRVTDGTDVAASAALAGSASPAAVTQTVGGTVTTGDVLTLTATATSLGGGVSVSYTTVVSDTVSTIATALAAAVNANAAMQAANISARVAGAVISLFAPASPTVTWTTRVTGSATETFTSGTGSTVTAGGTIQAIYTGILGNSCSVKIAAGTASGTFTVTVIPWQGTAEVFPNLPGVGFWVALQNALAIGLSTVRGPSNYMKLTNVNGAVGAPTTGTFTLSGGTDGRNGVTTAILLGSSGAIPPTGLWSLANQSPAVGQVWLVGCVDTAAAATLIAFGQANGCSTTLAMTPNITTAAAVALTQSLGAADPSFFWNKDGFYFFDTTNNQTRRIHASACIMGLWTTLTPEQSPGNKAVAYCLGTDRNQPNTNPIPYTVSEIGQCENAGILFISNPIPRGTVFGIRHGQSTSLQPATAPLEYWRMTMYLARSVAGFGGQFVDELQGAQANDPVRQAIRLQLNQFLQGLQNLGQIDSFLVTCGFSANPTAQPGLGLNTPTSIAQHYLFALVQVKYLSSIRFFVLSLQGGTTVVTVNESIQQQAA